MPPARRRAARRRSGRRPSGRARRGPASKTVKPHSAARSAMSRSPSTLQSSAQSALDRTTSAAPSGRADSIGMPRCAADRLDELAPAVPTHLDLGQQLAHRHRGRDVLPGLLGLAELVRGDRPLQQGGHGVAQLLDDEGLDDGTLDVAEVDEQLTEPPALELVGLDVEGGGRAPRGTGRRTRSVGRRAGRDGRGRRRSRSAPSLK